MLKQLGNTVMRYSPPTPERSITLVVRALVLLLSPICIAVAIFWKQLNSPLQVPEVMIVEVAPGSSLSGISDRLALEGLLENPLAFILWARLTGKAQSLQAGDYELTPATTPRQLLQKISAGEVKQYQLTLIEGWTFQEALEEIWRHKNITPTLEGQSNEYIATQLGLQHKNPEGLIFPDTYFYERGVSDLEILQRAASRLQSILMDSWNKRIGALPFDGPYDALILASIVEKETAVATERIRVAGVFIRRLEQGMRLQSDPTVIYGMGASFDGNIDRNALNEVTPYNTYRVSGLPPTPIALVGAGSIHASMNPELTDYLYFVSRGDGSHHFSATLEEHNEAVRRYQLDKEASQSINVR